MRTLLYILCIFMIGTVCGQEQESTDQKLGIKLSISGATLLGQEFQNPRPKFGYAAGIYYRKDLKKAWSLHTEFLGNFKGSKFSNGDTGYSRIALLYVDAAVLPKYSFGDDVSSVALGPYGSYLALSSLFVGGQQASEANDLALKPYDAGLAVYYFNKGRIASFQAGAKIGLVDINNGINFQGVSPRTGTGGFIRSVGIEVGVIF